VDLSTFAAEVGTSDPVTISGLSTRGGAVAGVRCVRAPVGIELVDAAEMVVVCGAGTAIAELQTALAEVGQFVALPAGGTVGGALAIGRSSIRRLGDGPVRESLLQARFVGAEGQIVSAGGPTVKNVSGFDLCKLLVGSRGTLGFLGQVRLRTRPFAKASQWFVGVTDPWKLHARAYRPVSILWDGSSTWVLLEGHPTDLADQASRLELTAVDGPPPLPTAFRWSLPPSQLQSLQGSTGFVAEIGVGIVHHTVSESPRDVIAGVRRLNERLKDQFDPTGRFNPGVSLLDV
jgi:FAD/FMN-containing dehydrogenase